MLDATPLNVHLHLDNLAHRLDAALEDVYWFTGTSGWIWLVYYARLELEAGRNVIVLGSNCLTKWYKQNGTTARTLFHLWNRVTWRLRSVDHDPWCLPFFQLPYAASKDCFHREGDWGRPLGLPLLIWTHSLVTSLTKVMLGMVCVKLFVWMLKINTFLSKITTRAFICFVFLSDSKIPKHKTQNKKQNTHTQNTKHTPQNTKHKT
jgi:hypothetical protein